MSESYTFSGNIEADGRRLKGSVVLAGSRTFRDGEWVEVDAKALMKADASNVFATIDHELNRIVGRTTNGTLTVSRTEDGISFETTELPNTSYANDALELAKGGYFGGSSFTIEGLRSKFSTDPETGIRVRTINSIKRLSDVAIVMDPAFANSTAAAFSKEIEVSEVAEPVVEQPGPPAPVVAQFTKRSEDEEAFDAAYKQAKQLPLESIENVLDNLMSLSKGNMTHAQRIQYDAFAKAYDELKATSIEAQNRIDALKFQHELRRGTLTKKAPEIGLTASDDYKAAFSKYLRTGEPQGMEQFAQSIVGDGTQGGYAVPDGFLNRIVDRMKAFGGVQKAAESITTATGQSLRWPSNDDTANSAVIATEGSAAGSGGADLVLGSIELGAFSFDATGTGNNPLKVSKELLQDAAFDLDNYVSRKLAERIGRKMAAAFATGAGTTEPFGLFNKSADVMSATTMYAALVEHIMQVDQAYRDLGSCRWIFGDTVLTVVYNSVDGNGRPLFQPLDASGGQAGPAGTLLGYPVLLDQGAGSLVAFGAIDLGFIIRYVRGVQIDVDPYTNIKSREIAYHAWARADSNIQDTYAVSVSDYSGVSADS